MMYEEDYFDWSNYQPKLKTNMSNGIGVLSWVNVKSALVYGVVMGVVAVVFYMVKIGTVFALDWHVMLDAFVYGVLTSVVKNILTTNEGNFLGSISTVDN